MDFEDRVVAQDAANQDEQPWALSLHSFSDLSCVSPVVFLYLLKESYIYGNTPLLHSSESTIFVLVCIFF